MDIKPLIQLVYPTVGETLDNLYRREHIKSFREFQQKYADRNAISLRDLITYADREDAPSLQLSEQAQRRLVALLTERCRAPTVEKITRFAGRSMSLMPSYAWAEQIMFTKDHIIDFCAGQSYPDDIALIRKSIMAS